MSSNSGYVIDAELGQPVEKAVVSMFSPRRNGGGMGLAQQVTTDAHGYFKFAESSESLQESQFEISKPPYYINSGRLEFRSTESQFPLSPAGYLKLKTDLKNIQNRYYIVSMEIFEKGKRIESYSGNSFDYPVFIPLKGNSDFVVSIRTVVVQGQLADSTAIEVNLPYRDTVEVDYTYTF